MVKKRKIFLFPGCFDPFHLQHQKIIENLFEQFDIDQLWILINETSQEKKIIASFKDRFNIIKINLENSKNYHKIKIWEQPIGFYTTTLVKELKKKNVNDTFSLILGQDQINNLKNWDRLENLPTLVDLIGIKRISYPKKDCEIEKFNIKYLTHIVPNNFNSSEIKKGYAWKNLSKKTRTYLWEKKIYFDHILSTNLSPQRKQHSQNVALLALKIWKNISKKRQEKIYFASLFHDLTKEWTNQKHINFLKKHQIDDLLLKNKHHAIWHGITASIFLAYEMMIEDEEILFAISHHSSAHHQFKTFDKVLFISDKLEKSKENDPFFKEGQYYLQNNKDVDINHLFVLTLTSVFEKIKNKNNKIDQTMKKAFDKFIKSE